MITSANIRVLFDMKSYSSENLIISLFQFLFLSLVFIDNHTVKYDIKKCAKYGFSDAKYQK